MSIPIKTSSQIDKMRASGEVVYNVHQALKEFIKPGVTTYDLDQEARRQCEKYKVIPAFLNYPAGNKNTKPFPAVICASPNEVIVHGIPNKTPLKDGDILSIDFGCSLDGFFGDSAWTYPVGVISESAKKLLKVTEKSLEAGIRACFPGNRIGGISQAIQDVVQASNLGIVREFVGHGIGEKMHEPPAVPNYGLKTQGRVLKAGMVLAIEPMITIGSYKVKILDDGWTASTSDNSLAAHFEHTVAVTDKGPLVLTNPHYS